MVDSDSGSIIKQYFRSPWALDKYIRHQRGVLQALPTHNQPHTVMDKSDYGSLDITRLYCLHMPSLRSSEIAQHDNQQFDKAWEQRSRRRLEEWFREHNISVIHKDRLVYEERDKKNPAAEWEGIYCNMAG
jgi:hypothetical protein